MSKKQLAPPNPKPKAEVKQELADKIKAVNNGDVIQKGKFTIPENKFHVKNHNPNEGKIK